jgi:hypothetical protein
MLVRITDQLFIQILDVGFQVRSRSGTSDFRFGCVKYDKLGVKCFKCLTRSYNWGLAIFSRYYVVRFKSAIRGFENAKLMKS